MGTGGWERNWSSEAGRDREKPPTTDDWHCTSKGEVWREQAHETRIPASREEMETQYWENLQSQTKTNAFFKNHILGMTFLLSIKFIVRRIIKILLLFPKSLEFYLFFRIYGHLTWMYEILFLEERLRSRYRQCLIFVHHTKVWVS